jgi:fatty acid-binding protein DegV
LAALAETFGGLTRGRDAHVAIHHANAPADAERLASEARTRTRISELYVTEFTQVMGVHTGPVLGGLAWWCE